MANVLNRTNLRYLRSVNTPEFNTAEWAILDRSKSTEISFVENHIAIGKPTRHLKIGAADAISEMDATEKRTEDRKIQRIVLASDAGADFDGVPVRVANAVDTHILTVSKADLSDNAVPVGGEIIRILPQVRVPLSAIKVTLSSGVATVTVGPLSEPADIRLVATDPLGILRKAEMVVRFK